MGDIASGLTAGAEGRIQNQALEVLFQIEREDPQGFISRSGQRAWPLPDPRVVCVTGELDDAGGGLADGHWRNSSGPESSRTGQPAGQRGR